jgi:WD40 repeat protein
MDYKQKYLKYKQKYLRLLKDQKGGKPFLMDILAGQVFSYLFERNQRQLQLIYTGGLPVMMQPLGNFTLNPKYRLNLLGRSGLSVMLAKILVQGKIRNNRLELQLANRIISRTHKLPKISPPTLAITLDRSNGGHNRIVESVAFHQTEPLLATCSSDNTVKLWSLVYTHDGSISSATCVATLDSSNGGHSSIVKSVAFHPKAPLFVTGSSDKTVKLWSLVHTPNGSISGATCLATLEGLSSWGHTRSVESVAFHPTAPLFVTGSSDKTVKLWSLVYTHDGSISSATCVATLDRDKGGHRSTVRSVAFHPTAPLFATGSSDNTIKLWHLVYNPNGIISANGIIKDVSCVATLDRDKGGHNQSVWSVVFHPTLPILATGSDDRTAKLWHLVYTPDGSISSTTCVATLDRDKGGHRSTVRSVMFHPTLPFLITGSEDDTIKLWHLVYTPDGSISAVICVETLNINKGGHSDSVYSVTFHPTLPLLATGSGDKTAKLWKL